MDAPKSNVIDASRFARRLHSALIEDLAKTQADLVALDLTRKMFGDVALPTSKIFRGHHDALTDAPRSVVRYEQHLKERHGQLIGEIRALEELLILEDHEDMKSFAEFFAEHFKQAKAADAKKAKERA